MPDPRAAVRQYAGNHKVKEKMRRRDATFRVCLTHGEKYVKVRKVAYCNMFMRGNNYKLIIN